MTVRAGKQSGKSSLEVYRHSIGGIARRNYIDRAITPSSDRHAASQMDALERADAGDAAWFAALDDDALERAMTRRDDDGRTSFHRACAAGARGRDVTRLARERMKGEAMARVVTTADDGGWTPLHTSAALGERETCGTLLARGADCEARTPGGQTPGHYAASKGRVGTLETLVSGGRGWLTMEDDVGATPLHRAAARGELRAIDFLVDALANGTTEVPKMALEARDKRGQTPLLVACEAGQDEAAIRLAKHGANVGAKDGEKRGVEELAPKLVSALAQIEAER